MNIYLLISILANLALILFMAFLRHKAKRAILKAKSDGFLHAVTGLAYSMYRDTNEQREIALYEVIGDRYSEDLSKLAMIRHHRTSSTLSDISTSARETLREITEEDDIDPDPVFWHIMQNFNTQEGSSFTTDIDSDTLIKAELTLERRISRTYQASLPDPKI